MAREYRLLDGSGLGNRLKKYRELVDLPNVGDIGYLWDDRWTEFEKSTEFSMLSGREQALARYTIKRIAGDGAPWLVQESDDVDNLVGMPSPHHVVPSTIDDAMILSGARGWEIYYDLIEQDHKNRQILGRLALRDYVDLAVVAVLYGSNGGGEADLSYFVDSDETTLRQTVGGTLHGDFIARWERFASRGLVRDPTGVVRDFAPALEGDIVQAYHSVEDKLAVGMLTYLSAGDPAKLERMKHVITDEIDTADLGRGGGNFADFGTNSKSYANEIFVDDFRDYQPGEIIESFTVVPGNQQTRMELVAQQDGVLLRNVIYADGQQDNEVSSEMLGEMFISVDKMPTFIASMAAASAGRTSLAEIRRAIANAKVWS